MNKKELIRKLKIMRLKNEFVVDSPGPMATVIKNDKGRRILVVVKVKGKNVILKHKDLIFTRTYKVPLEELS